MSAHAPSKPTDITIPETSLWARGPVIGGVLAVVLLIIVVLVLLYIFRADLGLGGKTVLPSTVNVNVNHS